MASVFIYAVANSTPSACQAIELFEAAIEEKPLEFPAYRVANIDELRQEYLPHNFSGIIKAILEVEPPFSGIAFKAYCWLFRP